MLKKIFTYSIGLYAVSLATSLSRIVVKSFVTKTIGKEALGVYAYYMALIMLASSVLAFGLRRAITKQVAAEKDSSRSAPVVVGIMVFGIAASLVLALAGAAIRPWVELVYVLVLISVGPYTLFEVARATLRGQFDQKREIALAMLGVIVQTGTVMLFALYGRNANAPVMGLAAANIVLAVLVALYFLRRYRSYWKPSELAEAYRSTAFRSLLVLSAPLWITDILQIVGAQADQIIVQGQLGYLQLAEYAAAFTFIGLLDQPITIMSRVFLVTFSGGHFNEYAQYKRVSSMNIAFFSVLGLLVMAFSIPLTPIVFSKEFTHVPLLVAILSVTSIFNSVEVLNSSLTIAVDYPQANRNSKILATLIYIPVAFFLVWRFGLIGAACSNVVSWGGYALVHAVYMHRRLPEHARHTFFVLLAGGALYIVTIIAALLIQNILFNLMIIPLYLGAGHLLRLWNLGDIPEILRRVLPRRLAVRLSGVKPNS